MPKNAATATDSVLMQEAQKRIEDYYGTKHCTMAQTAERSMVLMAMLLRKRMGLRLDPLKKITHPDYYLAAEELLGGPSTEVGLESPFE